jgi:outer membrane lipoprotein-sorting protein
VKLLRRISLTRLLLGCAVTVALGISLTALALALGAGPTPPAKPLAQAIHDVLLAPPVQGFSARVQLTNHLLEGADLASGGSGQGDGGGLTSSPLVNGASGRVWVSGAGQMRIELQAEQGDTQIIDDGTTLEMYDASTNTVYRLAPRKDRAGASEGSHHDSSQRTIPSVGKIEEGIAHLDRHASVSGAMPTDVGGRPAYTVRVAPREGGSLLAGVELSFDADNGVPLRAAVYSTQDASPVLELAASDISYGPVASSVFSFAPPPDAKIEELQPPSPTPSEGADRGGRDGKLTIHGHGPGAIAVLQEKAKAKAVAGADGFEELPQVKLGATSASELRTALGTLLSFERGGVRYVVAGSLTPSALEAFAQGLAK